MTGRSREAAAEAERLGSRRHGSGRIVGRPVQVLITNVYSARNAGDAAIVMGMVSGLRGVGGPLSSAEVTLSTANYPGDATHYPWRVVPSFHSLKIRVPGGDVLGGLYFLCLLLPLSLAWALCRRLTSWSLPVPGPLHSLLQSYARADLVVAAGGGYLYTRSARRGLVVLAVHLYSVAFGVLVGKPVYLYAQSIGPFAGRFQEWLVRKVLARVRMVQVREDASRELVRRWELAVPVREVVDAAFLLERREEPVPPREAPRDGLRVGMTVRSWFRDPAEQTAYEDEVARFLNRVLQEHQAEVVFVPQVSWAGGGDDDRVVARRIFERAGRPSHVRVVDRQLEIPEIMALCGQMDVFVGTRMHSNIFAASMGVPLLAIAYQPKTAGIMAQLGLPDLVVDIHRLSADVLADRFRDLLARRESVRSLLAAAIPEMRRRAGRGWSLISDDWVRTAAGVARR